MKNMRQRVKAGE